jgi:tetratricopeptide (TPR) repeat protein
MAAGAFAEGFELLKSGRAAEAEQTFQAGLRLSPGNALAYFYLGEAELKLGHPSSAQVFYARSLALDPKSAVATAAQAQLDALAGSTPTTTLPREPAPGAPGGGTAPTDGDPETIAQLQALGASPTPDGAARDSARSPPASDTRDPAHITLPSGITLADWEQYALAQLKAGQPEVVIKDAVDLWVKYQDVPGVRRIVAQAVDQRLAAFPIDDAEAAEHSLPALEQLDSALPGTRAAVQARLAKAIVLSAGAQMKHRQGDFEAASRIYREALENLEQTDDHRLAIVAMLQAATRHEPLLRRLPVQGLNLTADIREQIEASPAFQAWPYSVTRYKVAKTSQLYDDVNARWGAEADFDLTGRSEGPMNSVTIHTEGPSQSETQSIVLFGFLTIGNSTSIKAISISGTFFPLKAGNAMKVEMSIRNPTAESTETCTLREQIKTPKDEEILGPSAWKMICIQDVTFPGGALPKYTEKFSNFYFPTINLFLTDILPEKNSRVRDRDKVRTVESEIAYPHQGETYKTETHAESGDTTTRSRVNAYAFQLTH